MNAHIDQEALLTKCISLLTKVKHRYHENKIDKALIDEIEELIYSQNVPHKGKEYERPGITRQKTIDEYLNKNIDHG